MSPWRAWRSPGRGEAEPGSTAFAVLLALGVVDAAAYSVIAPVLPAIADSTGASPSVIGGLAAVFPLAMLFGLAGSGLLIRRGLGGPLLPVAIAVVAVGSLAIAVGTALPALFAARALMGVGSGGLWMGIAFRTLEYWPGQEYRYLSRLWASYSVGALVGPALGALPGIRWPFLAYLLVLLVALPFTLLLPRPTTRRGYVVDRSWRRLPGFWYASLGVMLGMVAIGMIDGLLPLHFATALTQSQIGAAYVATALVTTLAAVVAGHVRAPVALLVGGSALTVGITVAGASSAVGLWALALVLAGGGAGLAQTGSTGVLLAHVPAEQSVGALTVFSQVGMLGYLVAPLLGGPLVDRFGFASIGLVPLVLGLATLTMARVSRAP